MNKWAVELTKNAYKQFKKLPGLIQDLADEAICALEARARFQNFGIVKKLEKMNIECV